MKRIAAIIVVAGSCLAIGGCDFLDPKVESPFSGRPVTEAQLAREIRAEEAKAKAEADAKVAAAAEEVRAAKAKAVSTAIALQAKQAVTAAEIQATAATVEAETGARIEAAKAATEAAGRALADRLAELGQRADDAYAAIDARKAAYGGLIRAVADNPIVKSTDAATGGAITGLLGLAGGWIGRSAGSRKRHDASYDEGYAKAKAEAEEARNRENAAYDEAQARLHAMFMPPPKV